MTLDYYGTQLHILTLPISYTSGRTGFMKWCHLQNDMWHIGRGKSIHSNLVNWLISSDTKTSQKLSFSIYYIHNIKT